MLQIDTIILAAGTSRRLGFNKLCVRVDGKPVVRRTVEAFVESGVAGNIIVVTGFEREKVEREIEDLPVALVHNPRYREGMASSLKAGLARATGAECVCLHLGDKPFVNSATIRLIVAAYDAERRIVVPVHEGVKGHPVVMDVRKYAASLDAIEGDRGLRDIVEKHSAETLFVETGIGAVLDLDTEEQIAFLKRRGYTVEKG
jgi:molybdenum cofactor cytidylyltransferase